MSIFNSETKSSENTNGWISVVETASLLELSRTELSKLRKKGGGPSYRLVGTDIYYREKDVIRWQNILRRVRQSAAR